MIAVGKKGGAQKVQPSEQDEDGWTTVGHRGPNKNGNHQEEDGDGWTEVAPRSSVKAARGKKSFNKRDEDRWGTESLSSALKSVSSQNGPS